MELKKYQERVLEELETYLINTNKFGPKHAFISTTERPYGEEYFGEVPFVCIKVPTGGGKTLIATQAVKSILEKSLQKDKGIVLWFTPSEAIKSQTLSKLKDKQDFHRQILDNYFNNKVVILSNEEALRIKNHDVKNNICIIIASLDAFRKEKQKQGKYKVYQENGELLQFFENIKNEKNLEKEEGTIINSRKGWRIRIKNRE